MTPPGAGQPSSPQNNDTKLTLDNISEWDAAFTAAKGEEVKTGEPEPEKVDEAIDEEVEKPDAEVEETEEQEEEAVEGEPEKPKGQHRDYSKFDPSDVPALKQMSNAAFEVVEKRFDEFKASLAQKDAALAEVRDGKTLPDEWYHDPAAAEATPEFKAIKVDFDKMQAETHRLAGLLDAYEEGQLKYDAASGKFIPNDDDTPVSKSIARQLSDARMQAFEKQKELAAQGNGVIQNFSKVYKSAQEQVDGQTEKLLPWVKDEKHAWNKPTQDLLKQVPKVFRNHPLAKQVAALGAAAIAFKLLAEERDRQLKAKAGVHADQLRAGPNPKGGGRASNGEAGKKYTLKDFA